MATIAVRRLGREDAAGYRMLRLEALSGHPEAFGADLASEADRPLDWFAERIERSIMLGGLFDGALAGTAGIWLPDSPKERHKATLWSFYVRPQARGTGLADAMVAAAIEHTRGLAEEIRLAVTDTNHAAIRLYERQGFITFAAEPRALKIGDTYHGELLMARRV